MNILYKSSKFATYSQYIVSPIIIGIFLFQVYFYYANGFFMDEESLFFMPFWLWASIIVIINLIKIRYVKVYEDNILMKSLKGEEVLDYKNIEWINQNIFGSNWYIISVKYKNNTTGKPKVIFIFPEQYTNKEGVSILNPFGELNITKYIREQVIKANPAYRIENEPSRWYLAKWVFLSIIPFVVLSFWII